MEGAIVDLNLLWFILLGVLLAGYSILDGFDLGAGILHLTTRTDTERRLVINSIGPIWDGNEVWLVTFGGAMFAAFPSAYAAVFSGFYIALMLLLLMLILRAVSLEFRSKRISESWRKFWDSTFFLGSLLATLLFGVAAGNVLIGIPVDANGVFTGSFFDLLRPFPILTGLFTVTFAAMHGALYLNLKTEGELQQRMRGWIKKSLAAAAFCWVMVTICTWVSLPSASGWPWALVVLIALAFAGILPAVAANRPFIAFLLSSLAIAVLVFLFSFALYPNLVISNLASEYNLNIVNAASSPKTLGVMTVIAGVGVPIVLIYTAFVYRMFRGKVKLTDHSY
ncbi:MAG: cytochrome d ubiquinol oxidase subunit II [Acidobacteriota bacterium]|jgi:cytochrome d ubiquinol oxidase subunit II|nr:cytochrome d ubiquinol oxidase subunit II [Acidobacteriota bacterium]